MPGGRTMEFRVLGPLEIVDEGRPVYVSSARKPRLLLALLLAHGGAVLSVDALVEQVWAGAKPPASARRNLQLYLHQLRRVTGADRLLARPGGYALVTGADEVDASRFQRLAAAGAQSLADGDHALAGKLLRGALDLWRGEVYGEFRDAQPLAVAAARLEQERLAVYDQWAQAELALGRSGPLIAELGPLVQEHPFAENLALGLMRALHAVGRSAEALQVFRNLREALAEQLGIEPGEPLQEAHRAILRREPASPAPGPHPRQLPPDISHYVGREAELARLAEPGGSGQDQFSRVHTVYGPSGVGKSALVLRAAHALADQFPDGQLYVDLQGSAPGLAPLAPLEALERWLRALGVEGFRLPGSVAEASAMWRHLTAGRRMLLVVDNARDVAQVRPLLPASPECLTIVTSRKMLSTLDNAVHTRLAPLTARESLALLASFDPRCADGGQRDHLETVIGACGRLPLALRIVAAKLSSRPDWTVADLAATLRREQTRLDQLQQQDMSVRASISVSSIGLAEPAVRLLRLAGAFGCPELTTEVASAMLAAPASGLLARLADEQLIQPRSADRYALHDLVRLWAREEGDRHLSAAQREAALDRALAFYRASAWRAASLILSGDTRLSAEPPCPDEPALMRTNAEAAQWIDAELPTITALCAHAPDLRSAELARDLCFSLAVVCRWKDLRDCGRIAHDAGAVAQDRFLQGFGLEAMGLANCALGEPELTVRQATAAARLHPARKDVFSATVVLGYGLERLGRFAEMAQRFEEAVILCRDIGYAQGEARACDTLGRALRKLGRGTESVAAHREALAVYRRIDAPMTMANCLLNLGWAVLDTGDAAQAAEIFEEARELAERTRYVLILAGCLWGLGTARHGLGDLAAARGSWQASLEVLQNADNVDETEQIDLTGDGIPAAPSILRGII